MHVSHGGYVSDIGLYPRLCQLSNDVAVDNVKRRTTPAGVRVRSGRTSAMRKGCAVEQAIFIFIFFFLRLT